MTEKDESRKASIVTWGSLIAAGTLALSIVGGATAILNWQYNESNRIRADVTALQVDVAKNQVTKTEFKQSIQELKSEFKQSNIELAERFERGLDKIERRIDLSKSLDTTNKFVK